MSIVYRSGIGAVCPGCRRSIAQCVCKSRQGQPLRPNGAGPGAAVRVSRQTQGRAGKAVTLISGLTLEGAALDALAAQLKRRCGSGGTVRNGVIEIQGEHRDRLVEELKRYGYAAKRCGG